MARRLAANPWSDPAPGTVETWTVAVDAAEVGAGKGGVVIWWVVTEEERGVVQAIQLEFELELMSVHIWHVQVEEEEEEEEEDDAAPRDRASADSKSSSLSLLCSSTTMMVPEETTSLTLTFGAAAPCTKQPRPRAVSAWCSGRSCVNGST